MNLLQPIRNRSRRWVPRVMGPLAVLAAMDIPTVIALEADLSFLGMGVKPPTPSWGSILNDGYSLIRNTPWLIVAGGIPIVTGAGLAAQLEGRGRVAVSFFGDGASNAGPFHESINIAASWKLPMLYVCENNLWAVNTPVADTVPSGDVAARAPGYGIPGVVVDGNDVMAVHEAAARAFERVLEAVSRSARVPRPARVRGGDPDRAVRAQGDVRADRDHVLQRRLRRGS